ncbi:DUF6011 domain-containing protein [Kitasatospora sp. LaBMicrA B282]|uniref:DUF6011 domain-containing protein n=1 Tax=Kitasatospora sp. LaBMicrA B282 TaxID=3420949 RepID=UPI003D11E6F9
MPAESSDHPDLPLPGLSEAADAGAARLAERVTCRGCGRLLHDPESRMLRRGPGCRHTEEPVRRHEVAQEALPGL